MFLIASSVISLNAEITLKCEFSDTAWNKGHTLYTCHIPKTEESLDKTFVNGISDGHVTSRTTSDVLGFSVVNNTWNYIPNKISSYLPKLEDFKIENSGLKEIARTNFEGLLNLRTLRLWNNQLKNIEENTFDDLISLKSLYLEDNQLTFIRRDTFKKLRKLEVLHIDHNGIDHLPMDIFQNNLILRNFRMKDNKLKFIPSGTFDTLKELRLVDLTQNNCINYKMATSDQFETLKNELTSCNASPECKSKKSAIDNSLLDFLFFRIFFGYWNFGMK